MTHQPVLLAEVLEALAVKPEGVYVDATFGRGGHAAAILARLSPRGLLFAMDRDPEAVTAARAGFAADERVTVWHGSFTRLPELADAAGLPGRVDGLLADLGVSSPQLDDPARGFSFTRDGPLDMRMDNTAGVTAAQWLEQASERDIATVLRRFGEEPNARRIARAIVTARREAPMSRTAQLAAVVERVAPRRPGQRHPATRTFQALRIVVNRELEEVRAVLEASLNLLRVGGRLAVITFHSLEDRIVKRFIRTNSRPDPVYAGLPDIPPHALPRLRSCGKPVRPGAQELAVNPRARSAVLRVAERRGPSGERAHE